MSQCTIPDCPDAAVAKNLCAKHYMRLRRRGDAGTAAPLKIGRPPSKKPPSGPDTAALESEIARLRDENASLRQQAAKPPPRPVLRPRPAPVSEPPLPPSAQQRLDAHRRRLEREFDQRVQAAAAERGEARLRACYAEIDELRATLNAARRGALTATQYRDLLAIISPNNFSETDEPLTWGRATAMFQLFNTQTMKDVLIKPEEAPLPPSAVPREPEDWMMRREQASANRSNRRRRTTATQETP